MEMKNPHVIWASVAIIFMLVAPASVLAGLGKDVTVILTLAALVAMPVLAGLGVAVYQKMEQVREQGNGNTTKQHELTREILEMQRATQQQLTVLAMSMTPASREDGKAADDLTSQVLL